jgi:hypothetical protein
MINSYSYLWSGVIVFIMVWYGQYRMMIVNSGQ